MKKEIKLVSSSNSSFKYVEDLRLSGNLWMVLNINAIFYSSLDECHDTIVGEDYSGFLCEWNIYLDWKCISW